MHGSEFLLRRDLRYSANGRLLGASLPSRRLDRTEHLFFAMIAMYVLLMAIERGTVREVCRAVIDNGALVDFELQAVNKYELRNAT